MQFEITREYIENLKELIANDNQEAVKALMEEFHPADIAEVMDDLNHGGSKVHLPLLEGEKASDVLIEIPEADRRRFLKNPPT